MNPVAPPDRRPLRVWIASELMYPEVTSTGYDISAIAERLARSHAVEVLCAQPTYAARGTRTPRLDTWRGVTIRRLWSTTFDKNRVLGRVSNLVTFSLSSLVAMLWRIRARDVMLVVTNPPTLNLIAGIACWFRDSRYVLLINDLYPDELMAVAGLSERRFLVRVWRWANRKLFAGAERIIVVGRDLEARILREHPQATGRTVVIPDWAEIDTIRPSERQDNRLIRTLGLADRFVVLYAGNLGRPNDVETIVRVAGRLQRDARFHFVFVGSGAKEVWLQRQVREEKLLNVTLLGAKPRSEQGEFLNAGNIGIVTVVRGMRGVAVPSRLYNFMAAGTPVVGIVETDSEVDFVIRETQCGWVTPPHDPDAFEAALLDAASDPARLAAMGARARRRAEEYSGERSLEMYETVIASVTQSSVL